MLKEVRGGASRLNLDTDLTAASTTMTVSGPALANWPTGIVGPFVIRIEDELLLCSNRAGQTINVAQRGWDTTAPASHTAALSVVRHVIDADTIADALGHIYKDDRDDHSQYMRTDGSRPFDDVSGLTDTPVPIGTELAAGSRNTLARSDHIHRIDDNSIEEPKYKTDSVSRRAIAPDAISEAEIADTAIQEEHFKTDAVSSHAIAAGAVGTSELADKGVTEPDVGDKAISNRTLADEAVDSRVLGDGSVDTGALQDGACTSPKHPDDGLLPIKYHGPRGVLIRKQLTDNAGFSNSWYDVSRGGVSITIPAGRITRIHVRGAFYSPATARFGMRIERSGSGVVYSHFEACLNLGGLNYKDMASFDFTVDEQLGAGTYVYLVAAANSTNGDIPIQPYPSAGVIEVSDAGATV